MCYVVVGEKICIKYLYSVLTSANKRLVVWASEVNGLVFSCLESKRTDHPHAYGYSH